MPSSITEKEPILDYSNWADWSEYWHDHLAAFNLWQFTSQEFQTTQRSCHKGFPSVERFRVIRESQGNLEGTTGWGGMTITGDPDAEMSQKNA
jgi:hypothetical protein